MTVQTATTTPADAALDRVEAIREFLAMRAELEGRGFGETLLAPMRELGAPLLFRTIVPAGTTFVGFVGCTKVGKSTIFNSLFGGEVSPVDWRSHTTRSPIFLFHRPTLEAIRRVEQSAGPLLLSDRRTATVEEHGRLRWQDAGTTYLVPHEKPELGSVVLVDMPDSNSKSAEVEGDVALEVLPWLDVVVFVITEQTAFDPSLEPYVKRRAELGLRSLVVLTRTERKPAGMSDPALARRVADMGADGLLVLPAIKGKLFQRRAEFVELRDAILNVRGRLPVDRLLSSLARTAQGVLAANAERAAHLHELESSLARLADAFRPQLAFDARGLLPPEATRLLALRGWGGLSLVNQLRASPLPQPGRWVEILSERALRLRIELAAEKLEKVPIAPAWECTRILLEDFDARFLATWRTSAYATDLAAAKATGPGAFDFAELRAEGPFHDAVRSCLHGLCTLLRDPAPRRYARAEAIGWPVALLLVLLDTATGTAWFWPSFLLGLAAWLRALAPEGARLVLEPAYTAHLRACAERVRAIVGEPFERMTEHYRPERFSQMILREEERGFQVLRKIAEMERPAGSSARVDGG